MRFGESSLIKYLAAGGLNTGLTYLLYLLLLHVVPYIWAYSLTFVAGIMLGYLLNTFWVFKARPGLHSLLRYPLLYVVNYLFGIGLLWLLVERLKIAETFGPLLVLILSVPVMYILTKIIFSREKKQ
ncbi:GtrA family protein [Herbaspirillum rubrisubalbicans]|uniref:GtrA family protein n=1 Tax=Herbaspirillum rubrisubalbicans TaxID=80842 RepID=A0AAD0U4B5_9BURK|nr:GtrA family protein [Herbaspirillum rubrisubalbicans]AYR22740.1 GtrA family protein [Herbaspirillum rubrisubalbicans]